MPNTFPLALVFLMKHYHITIERLSEYSGVGLSTIKRLRKQEQQMTSLIFMILTDMVKMVEIAPKGNLIRLSDIYKDYCGTQEYVEVSDEVLECLKACKRVEKKLAMRDYRHLVLFGPDEAQTDNASGGKTLLSSSCCRYDHEGNC